MSPVTHAGGFLPCPGWEIDLHTLQGYDDLHTISCMVGGRVYRMAADGADTYDADAILREYDIHFLKDDIGSTTEWAK